jgi:nucleotide-binding universal stress UspA family protein
MNSNAELETIVIATDFSPEADRAVAVGARLARHSGASVILFHAYDPLPLGPVVAYPSQLWSGADFALALKDEGDKLLAETRERLLDDIEHVEIVNAPLGSASVAICNEARDRHADLVVVGTHGRTGVARILIGSVAEQVVRHAPCAVLTVHPTVQPETFPRRIVVTTDFSADAEPALTQAAALARRYGAPVTLVHVYETSRGRLARDPAYQRFEDVEDELRGALEDLYRERVGAEPSVELLQGRSAPDAIVEYARAHGFDLIAISTHGRTGLARLLIGSVAERVTRHAHCPVWTARPPKEVVVARRPIIAEALSPLRPTS